MRLLASVCKRSFSKGLSSYNSVYSYKSKPCEHRTDDVTQQSDAGRSTVSLFAVSGSRHTQRVINHMTKIFRTDQKGRHAKFIDLNTSDTINILTNISHPYKYFSMVPVRVDFGTAPMTVSSFWPPLKIMTVGMERMPYSVATLGLSSVFNLTYVRYEDPGRRYALTCIVSWQRCSNIRQKT